MTLDEFLSCQRTCRGHEFEHVFHFARQSALFVLFEAEVEGAIDDETEVGYCLEKIEGKISIKI